MRLLALLRNIEWSGYNGLDRWDCCPECGGEETKYKKDMVPGHREGCELKDAIDHFEKIALIPTEKLTIEDVKGP